MKSESFRIDSKATDTFKAQKCSKNIDIIVHVTISPWYNLNFTKIGGGGGDTKITTLLKNVFWSKSDFDACSQQYHYSTVYCLFRDNSTFYRMIYLHPILSAFLDFH